MRIAFFSKQLPSDAPNGVSCQVHRLANALVARGHAVTCFSFSPRPADARYDHRPLDWGTSSRASRKFVPGLRFRSVDTTEFDIVHYHGDDYLCRGSTRRVRTFYGSALQEALHGRSPSRVAYQSLFYVLEWISCLHRGSLVAISRETRRSLPMVRRVIPCGVPLDRYTPGTKSPVPTVLFLGDLDSRKNGRAAVAAFQQTVLPAMPQARLRIVGPQPCSGAGVDFLGRLSEERLIDEYRAAWVLCLASTYEGFGVPLVEAMACGCAVAALDSPGSRALVSDRVNGLLAPPPGLGTTILRLVSDEELRKDCVAGGLRSALAFDIQEAARAYEALYSDAIGGRA